MDSLAARIKQRRKEINLNQTQLAKLAGMAQSDISKLERGDSRSTTRIAELARALQCDAVWLSSGDEPSRTTVGEKLAPPYLANVSAATPRRRVPLISWVRAGMFDDVADVFAPGEADDWITAYQSSPSGNAFALRVEGDSMTAAVGRSFPDGCIIIVDPNRSPQPGDFVIAKDVRAQRATFKQLTTDGLQSYLKPLNTNYPVIAINSEHLRIVAVVIEYFVGGKL